jgi:hypothetical protein
MEELKNMKRLINKNTYMIILLLIIFILINGCSTGYYDYAIYDLDNKDKNNYLLKNYQYLDICKKEYKDSEQIGDGYFRCFNNNIKIEIKAYENNTGLFDINLIFNNEVNIEDVLNELNKIYQSNNLKKMSLNQLNELINDEKIRKFNNIQITSKYDDIHNENLIVITGYKVDDKDNYIKDIK